jgi:Plasmid pRiA4b ORF-3-like protein
MPAKTPPRDIYQIKVTLIGIEPPIWRRFLVPRDITLNQLHTVLQVVMGWGDEHLHEFVIKGRHYRLPSPGFDFDFGFVQTADEDATVLGQAVSRTGTKFLYEYDFGDSWAHLLQVERMLPRQEGMQYPACVAGARHGPPEDCGGAWGYQGLLEAIADPDDPDYDDRREWVGEDYDPEAFDRERINRRLAGLNW